MPRGPFKQRSALPIPTSLPPSGPAGGDLGGSYPNPLVVGFQGRPVSAAAPNVGDAYVWSGALWVPAPFPIALSAAVLGWGASSVSNTTTTRYLFPWYEDSMAFTTPIQWRSPRVGTARLMRVRQNVPAGNGNAIVYTLRRNNVATALSVSMASTATDGSNLVATVGVVAGDLLDIEVTKALNVAGAPNSVALVLELA